MDSRMDLNFWLVGSETDVDSWWLRPLLRRFWRRKFLRFLSFVQVISVLHSLPTNNVYYSPKKMADGVCGITAVIHRIGWSSKLNNLVRDLCRGFGNKVRKLKPGHWSFSNFTKITKNQSWNEYFKKVFEYLFEYSVMASIRIPHIRIFREERVFVIYEYIWIFQKSIQYSWVFEYPNIFFLIFK
jgi:hypothetical protein